MGQLYHLTPHISRFTPFIIISCGLFLSVASCSFFKKKTEQKALARAYNHYLYPEDIAGMVPKGTSRADSIQIVQNYIQAWIKKNLLIEKAELNLTNEQKDVEAQLNEYRTSLIIFNYEKEYIRQYLDTVVSLDEIQQYYDTHKKDFVLKDNIVDVAFVKLKKSTTKLDKARKWFISDKEQDLLALEDFCYSNALDFSFKKENWMSFRELIKIVPLNEDAENTIIKSGSIIELTDSVANYMVRVNDYKLRNSISPLNFEIENIRNIVINKRKLKLIESLENSLYKTAQANEEFEVY